jgi:hypothetical protein
MGVAWPLVLLSPLVYVVSCSLRWSVGASASTVDAVVRGAVLHMQALIWLAVLFSRPHKVAFSWFSSFHLTGRTDLRLRGFIYTGGALPVPHLPSSRVHRREHAGPHVAHPYPPVRATGAACLNPQHIQTRRPPGRGNHRGGSSEDGYAGGVRGAVTCAVYCTGCVQRGQLWRYTTHH